jgi:hypothetical protein
MCGGAVILGGVSGRIRQRDGSLDRRGRRWTRSGDRRGCYWKVGDEVVGEDAVGDESVGDEADSGNSMVVRQERRRR